MKANLKGIEIFRIKINELLEDLEERKRELENRDDPDGTLQKEIDFIGEVKNLIYDTFPRNSRK